MMEFSGHAQSFATHVPEKNGRPSPLFTSARHSEKYAPHAANNCLLSPKAGAILSKFLLWGAQSLLECGDQPISAAINVACGFFWNLKGNSL